MRRNLLAAILLVAGLGLTGAGVNGLGLLAGGPAHVAPSQSAAGVGALLGIRHDPGVLAGVSGPTESADPNTPIGRITIPRLGVAAPIYDRGLDQQRNMVIAGGYAVTHFQYSSLIGAGNAVLYGHDDIQGSVFGRLGELRTGDVITISLSDGEQQVWHVIQRRIVAPSEVAILDPTPDTRLTLFTCWPTWVDTQRVVVTASLS